MKHTHLLFTLLCGFSLLFTTGIKAQNYRSLELDGIDDYISAGTSDTFNVSNNLSIEVWVKISETQNYSSWNRIVDKMDFVNDAGYNLVLNDTKLRFEFFNTDGGKPVMQSISDVKDNLWHYVVVTFDSIQMRIYIDGELDNSSNITKCSIQPGTKQLAFGNNNDGNGWLPLTGQLDEVRLWNRVLSPQEIATYMNSYISLEDPGLLGYWNLNVSVDTIVPDLSPLANHGVLRNGAQLIYDVPYETLVYSDTLHVTVEDTLNIIMPWWSLEDIDNEMEIKVYPNPATEFLFIEVDDITGLEDYSIKFYNSVGQELYTTQFTGPITEIDIANLIGEIYVQMVIVDNNGKVLVSKTLAIFIPV